MVARSWRRCDLIATTPKRPALPQEQVASASALTDEALGRIEIGDEMPDYSTLLALSSALGLTLGDLLAPTT